MDKPSFAQSCKELMDEIKDYEKEIPIDLIVDERYWQLRYIKEERLSRAKDEVEFLKEVYSKFERQNDWVEEASDILLEGINYLEIIEKRIVDLQEGIKILEQKP